MTFEETVEELLQATGASRTTLRLDSPDKTRIAANASIDNAPMLFVFTLDGKAELPKPAPPTPAR